METGLLSIIRNPHPLLSMHQPEEWPLAMLSCLMVHAVLLIFLLPLGPFPSFLVGLLCIWPLNVGMD